VYKPFGGTGACTLNYFIVTATIPLSRSLDGRHVEGADPSGTGYGAYRLRPRGGSYPIVPRLVGLGPPDAKFPLAGSRLRAVVHVIGHTRGLARVVSESPLTGSRDPKDRIVRINVLRHTGQSA